MNVLERAETCVYKRTMWQVIVVARQCTIFLKNVSKVDVTIRLQMSILIESNFSSDDPVVVSVLAY